MLNLIGKLESLLFVAGEEGVSLDELAYLVSEKTNIVYGSIKELEEKYREDASCAFHILEVGNQFVLSTKKEFASVLKNYAQSPMSNHLSQAALETLSIIAYKQPITRVEIDEIRGVQSTGSIQKLLARQLIQENGRVEGPGRPILYGTSDYFMNYFGLEKLTDLPSVEEMEKEFAEEMPNDLFFDKFKDELEEQGIHGAEQLQELVVQHTQHLDNLSDALEELGFDDDER